MENTGGYTGNYYMHFAAFAVVAAVVILFHLRKRWVPKVQQWRRNRQNQYVSLISLSSDTGLEGFQDDINNGLTSTTFDLLGNISGQDSRKGLDVGAKKEIIAIMNSNNVSFDEARAIYTKKMMASNQIGPDGMPLDPRTFTFS